jgi:hypothetical protein
MYGSKPTIIGRNQKYKLIFDFRRFVQKILKNNKIESQLQQFAIKG